MLWLCNKTCTQRWFFWALPGCVWTYLIIPIVPNNHNLNLIQHYDENHYINSVSNNDSRTKIDKDLFVVSKLSNDRIVPNCFALRETFFDCSRIVLISWMKNLLTSVKLEISIFLKWAYCSCYIDVTDYDVSIKIL